MTNKDKNKNSDDEEPIELSSSPCSINEVNPDYMGLSGLGQKPPKLEKKKNKK